MNQNELERLLEDLIQEPHETEWLEFKVNKSYPHKLIGEYISALSNSACLHEKECGYLVYGIDDKTHEVVGTEFNPKETKEGNEELENWLARNLDPRIDFKIHQFFYKDKSVIIFVVDAATVPISFQSIEYIRIGSCKQKLKDNPGKEKKIWTKHNEIVFEEGIAAKKLDADEALNLIDYVGYFHLLNQPLPFDKKSILHKLEEEHIIIKEGRSYSITNLGAILFSKDLAKFSKLHRKAVRVIIYKGKDRLETIKEQVGGKGYATGFEGLIDYVNDKLPVNEEIGRAFRKEIKVFPELAIRELVVNALIHQDFTITGTSPMIELFADRMEITNPGKPLISTLRFIDHSPRSRNEKLASLMRRMNICEERGSGIDKVISQCEEHQLPAPDFKEDESSLKVILYAHKPLNSMQKEDKVRACYQHCCLKYVSNDLMSNQSLRERFMIDEKNYSIVSRIIGDTIQQKLIKDFDPTNKSRKFAKYIPFWA